MPGVVDVITQVYDLTGARPIDILSLGGIALHLCAPSQFVFSITHHRSRQSGVSMWRVDKLREQSDVLSNQAFKYQSQRQDAFRQENSRVAK